MTTAIRSNREMTCVCVRVCVCTCVRVRACVCVCMCVFRLQHRCDHKTWHLAQRYANSWVSCFLLTILSSKDVCRTLNIRERRKQVSYFDPSPLSTKGTISPFSYWCYLWKMVFTNVLQSRECLPLAFHQSENWP